MGRKNCKVMYDNIQTNYFWSRPHKDYKEHEEKRKEKKVLEKIGITKLFLLFYQPHLDVTVYLHITKKIFAEAI